MRRSPPRRRAEVQAGRVLARSARSVSVRRGGMAVSRCAAVAGARELRRSDAPRQRQVPCRVNAEGTPPERVGAAHGLAHDPASWRPAVAERPHDATRRRRYIASPTALVAAGALFWRRTSRGCAGIPASSRVRTGFSPAFFAAHRLRLDFINDNGRSPTPVEPKRGNVRDNVILIEHGNPLRGRRQIDRSGTANDRAHNDRKHCMPSANSAGCARSAPYVGRERGLTGTWSAVLTRCRAGCSRGALAALTDAAGLSASLSAASPRAGRAGPPGVPALAPVADLFQHG